MDAAKRTEVLNRLKSIEGHIRGVQKMVEDDRYCIDVLKQTAALKGAIDQVDAVILANHLNTCVTTAIRSENPNERERVVGELMTIFDGQASGRWGRSRRQLE